MIFKLAFVLLSALVQTTVLAESTPTRLERAAQDIRAGGEERTNHLRTMKKSQVSASIAIEDSGAPEEDIPDQRALKKRRRRKSLPSNQRKETESRDDDEEEGWEDESSEPWSRGTFEVAAKRRDNVEVCTPSQSQVGDMLVLFISSSGGSLPTEIDGWKRGAECFKTTNKQATCSHTAGKDLGTVMFYRKFADPDDCWVININGGTTWAIMTAITNVNDQSPIGDVKEVSCDKSRNSVFPSVNGGKDDVVLFSQGFDDAFGPNDFIPMSGASRLAYMKVHQDAGFLMGKKLDHPGPTGSLRTQGKGGELCKDVLMSIVVKRLGD